MPPTARHHPALTAPAPQPPSAQNWNTSDDDEILRRRFRANAECFSISNLNRQHPIFSNFAVKSSSGSTYSVEIRDLKGRQFACDCVDFRINGLGTCKHVEGVLQHLEGRFRRLFDRAARSSSNRWDVVPDSGSATLRLVRNGHPPPASLGEWFDANGRLCGESPENALDQLKGLKLPNLRISQEVGPWLAQRRQVAEVKGLRQQYELKVQSGEWPLQETLVPLFPYQRDGMLHLAFTERAMLADEMGLGKTIQAIAACALLHRLGQARRALVVTPASLKSEWEEQIQRFTTLPYQLVFGHRGARLAAYAAARAPFFTIVNYEQMVRDALDVNEHLRPDIVLLDEAQRIKNWNTKTAQAIKRLKSRYAFVLTGTPIENRIDELYSLMSFLNPSLLGPLFRFNRDFYQLDDRGRPADYKNLQQLHDRIRPYMLRRRKAEVETELPDRTDRTHFVPLSPPQKDAYGIHYEVVSRLAFLARRRPLSQQEQDKLMRHLAMMRMICDSNYILDPNDRICPKLAELEKILEECRENADVKVIIFSEWERMLELVRDLCDRLRLGYGWHTGSVPQRRRRGEINAFKSDPRCRVFLSTDAGATGLNLQNASIVINCDLPWNPAKLEQRIARAWRKHQTRAVTVINLVSEGTIEHRMLGTLADKKALSDGVLDLQGDLSQIKLRTGRQAFLAKLEQLITPRNTAPGAEASSATPPVKKPLPPDRPLAFGQRARDLMGLRLVNCEEHYPREGPHSVVMVVVEGDAPLWREKLSPLADELFGNLDPLAPIKVEVVDRSTDEAIQRLAAAGLLKLDLRARRPLSDPPPASGPSPLPEAEQVKAAAHREQAKRKLKMARLLAGADLLDEARTALLESSHSLARALAIEMRQPEPGVLSEALLPPLSLGWAEALQVLREFASNPSGAWQPVAEALSKHLQG